MACTLGEMPVFVLDCQTTGAHPERGHLLEVGWCFCRPGAPAGVSAIASRLVALPPPGRIPGPIARLTGITAAQMQAAVSRRDLWGLLRAVLPGEGAIELADGAAACPGGALVTAVAHYARFEELFLRHLHAECEPDRPFPLRFVCTHENARRLFPDLPRRGLHALAGYFGHSLPEL
jgi:DNA polymerase-3 subunit epsilon